MKKNKVISPIAIDMGAKNNGVLYAHYEKGSKPEEIKKHAEVLIYNDYTPLLKNRTASRHTRRGYQRKKLAKRLLTVILRDYFKFPAEEHRQAIGFFMNRRGFSFLEEDYSQEYLNQMPDVIWNKLSKDVQNFFEGNKNIATQLIEIRNSDNKKITKLFESLLNIDGYKECQMIRNNEDAKQALKDSIWNFKYDGFELEKNEDILNVNIEIEEKTQLIFYRTHLQHFFFAVYKMNSEITSVGRHRTKFFKEIEKDLSTFNNEKFLTNSHSPKYIINFIQQINNNQTLDFNKLYKLICHISNLELKPLRSYFNKISYKDGYKLDLKDLSTKVSRWFMKHWIVTKDKDNEAKVISYKRLKNEWFKHCKKEEQNIIEFWLNIDPVLTIPPYQAMLNRHPPKCQSLILNAVYLNDNYPSWKSWLKDLGESTTFQEKLEKIATGKGKRGAKNKQIDGKLIRGEAIQLRQLQLILDTTKKWDQYNLNELWSIYHQWQKPETKNKHELQEKLEKVIVNSKLPNELKKEISFEKFNHQGSFAHFINKYYQVRRKARDGRYFLIQEKKEKWLSEGKLLTLCTHRPRQKKYQWKIDLAMVLGVDIEKLHNITTLEEDLKSIKGLATNCKKADKAQKDYRGELKTKILNALTNKTNKKNDELAKIAENCYRLKEELISKIKIEGLLKDKQSTENDNKIALVFKFAQIHNIFFKDRTGFSKTCPVCSTDNSFRMQENEQGIARSSRLSALSIRLIDGVVMRICDAIARQVAVTKWEDIEQDLQNGAEVSIPLIIEQNRFEFEPSLRKIKEKKAVSLKDDRDNDFNEKNKRIKNSVNGISAYSGKEIVSGEIDGEIDHIIPRTSKYGILNDEANLIYLSKDDNQTKSNEPKYLRDLNLKYKESIFGKNITDEKIKDFIYKQLGEDLENDKFLFGRYLSFIGLTKDQQKAFRHALFLNEDDPVKKKVIKALQNRNRTIVNGTQRYLAQIIADKIYRIAITADKKNKTNYTKQIQFDYFEYSAKVEDPKSTYNLRKHYGLVKPKFQPLYSHLIDAQLAFLLAVEDHKNAGSMGLVFDDSQSIWQSEIDQETGEVLPSKLFDSIDVGEEKLTEIDLSPKNSNQKIIDIEDKNLEKKQDLSKIFKRSIFKKNAMGERYKPIVNFNDEWYIGYPMTVKNGIYSCEKYCNKITRKKDIEEIVASNKYYQLTTDNEQIKIWTIKVVDKKYKQIDKDSHKYFSQINPVFDEDENKEIAQIEFILENCKYYVSKTDVINAPHVLSKNGNDKYPFYQNWKSFHEAWKKEIGSDYSETSKKKYDVSSSSDIESIWKSFCQKWFSSPKNQIKNQHQAKGKTHSMISLGSPSGAMFRINRNGQNIYQALPLDTNIIGKDKANFLIKHSKYLTLISKKNSRATNLLSQGISSEEINVDVEVNSQADIFNEKFKNRKYNTTAKITNNRVDLFNFPLSLFKDNKALFKGKKTIKFNAKLENENKEEIENTIARELKEIIKLPFRIDGDSSITKIEIKGQEVNFSLSCKKEDAKKFEIKFKENNARTPNT